MEFTIDPEFSSLIPSLSEDEFSGLEQNLLNSGCLHSLIVWDGLLLDGHNRLKICQKHNLTYEIKVITLSDRESAKDWIRENQLGRRNLTAAQYTLILGDLYNSKKQQGFKGNQYTSGKDQIGPYQTTAEQIAKKYGIGAMTVKRAGKLVAELTPEDRVDILKGDKTRIQKGSRELNKANNLSVRSERVIAETKKSIKEDANIIKGDCLKLLASTPSIDLLLTDPPYFTDGNFTAHISAFLSCVKSTGQAYVFIGSDPLEISAYLEMERHGMQLEQILIWNYNNTGQRQPKYRYNSNYQIALYFRGEGAAPITNPSDGTHQYACQTINAPDGRLGDRYHKWQKPIELAERYILNSSKPGDLVCDPFAGKGTFLLAAAKYGRKSIGYELDEDAISIATERGCIRGSF